MVDLTQGYISPTLLKDFENYGKRLGSSGGQRFRERYVHPQDASRPNASDGGASSPATSTSD
jgi:hypothetical protein